MVLLLRLAIAIAALALAAATASGAATAGVAAGASTTTLTSALSGIEVPPISSTRGTFVGVAGGTVRFSWRAQIVHVPLSAGAAVPVTGGHFTLLSAWGRRLRGAVTGGSVAVVDRGSGCRDQRYRVEVTSTVGSFAGTLVHNRRSILGQCLITSATIDGDGAFIVPETFTRSRLP
jgi:hypothetical protein